MLTDNEIASRIHETTVNTGPAFTSVLEGLAANHGSKHPKALIAGMIEDGTIVRYGARRGTRWGAPGLRGLK